MLHQNEIEPIEPETYRPVAPAEQLGALAEAARAFRGKRLVYVSSTAQGGGVAEMLRPAVALYRGLGVSVDWLTIDPPAGFFEITKRLHNALQGGTVEIGEDDWRRYESINRDLAKELDSVEADAVIVHDPQPAAARAFLGDRAQPWLWRCHLDLSAPNLAVAKRFVPLLQEYDGAIYSMDDYALPGFAPMDVATIAPVIDPLSPKNQPMPSAEAARIVAEHGIDTARPLITQVSRFDPWKDPVGVIAAWQLARSSIPGLQVALVGNTVNDDPESFHVLDEVRAAARGRTDVHIVDNLPPAENDRGVKAFYVASDVVLQKSTREGFGLTVSEALWAERPVIGGNVGGITLQIQDGKSGYLVDSVEAAAEAIVRVVPNAEQRQHMGRAGHAHIRQHFLLPRLLVDELRFLAGILGS